MQFPQHTIKYLLRNYHVYMYDKPMRELLEINMEIPTQLKNEELK